MKNPRPGAKHPIYKAHHDRDEIHAEPWQGLLERTTEKLGAYKEAHSGHGSFETLGCLHRARRFKWYSKKDTSPLREWRAGGEVIRVRWDGENR